MKTAKLIFIFFTSLVFVAACGGGSEPLSRSTTPADGSGGGQTTPTYSIAMSIVDMQGNEATQLTDGSPLNINVLVLNTAGNPVSGQLVTYELSLDTLANFNNDTSTSLTNSDGIATIQITVTTLSGSGTVSASLSDATSVLKGFQSLGTQQAAPSSIELYANAVQLASSGGDTIELIAVVKNEQNALLSGVDVSFSVDENASLSEIDGQTGADGTARATLSTLNNKQNRTITVNATSFGLTQALQINVVGTEVNINGASSVIINDSAPITIVLSDSDGQGIANQTVNLTATLGLLDNAAPVTGENGQITVNFSASEAGNSTITASALNANTSFSLVIQQDDFSFDALPTESLDLDTSHDLSLRWFKNNTAFANGSVTVTTSRGEISVNGVPDTNTTTTDASGIATVGIRSEFAGPASISAIGTDADGNQVTARALVEFVATTVDSIFVDATPDLIGPDGQTTTITAVVRDAKGNLVKGKTVNFRLVSDASGGSIAPNTSITDSNGIASSVYTSNAVSGDSGVTVSAQSDNVVGSTDLTVGDRAFDISLGTGSVIEVPDSSTYLKEFAVFVTDASGRPVANAELTGTVTPTFVSAFAKGYWVWNDLGKIYETFDADGVSTITIRCLNEDANKDGRLVPSEDTNSNGVLDAGEDTNGNGVLDLGEDTNGDGLLTPGNVSSVSFKDNISRTNEFGQATLQVRYPKQFGQWSTVVVKVFGQSAGSESMQSQVFTLGVAASDLTEQASPPPNSPFGLGLGSDAVCTNTN